MSEEWRIFLYPLGLVSVIAFSLRFLVQWVLSEVKKESVVPKVFWQLSLLGNSALLLHSAVQLQYHVCVIQAINAVIALRNLNLMQEKAKHWRLSFVVLLMTLAFLIPTACFMLWSPEVWFRIPTHLFSPSDAVSFFWHWIGFLGVFLFALRFWLQWVDSEREGHSTLEASFWQISLIGACFSLAYFLKIHDIVNLLGPLFGVIPYLRNLMLLSSNKKRTYESR